LVGKTSIRKGWYNIIHAFKFVKTTRVTRSGVGLLLPGGGVITRIQVLQTSGQDNREIVANVLLLRRHSGGEGNISGKTKMEGWRHAEWLAQEKVYVERNGSCLGDTDTIQMLGELWGKKAICLKIPGVGFANAGNL